jgi:polyhydroxyalkanoate synthesis regulator phasin
VPGRIERGFTLPAAKKPATRKSPTPRKKSSGTASRRGAAAKPAPAAAKDESLRDGLQRFLDPREVLVVTRVRLQEALDEAVERGRMTRDDAGDLLADLVRRGDELRDGIEALIGGARSTTRKTVSGQAERALREVDRARRATGLGPTFPILGYDDLTAAQVNERLGDLSPAELRKVRDYEKRNANRKSVLAAVEQKLK